MILVAGPGTPPSPEGQVRSGLQVTPVDAWTRCPAGTRYGFNAMMGRARLALPTQKGAESRHLPTGLTAPQEPMNRSP